MVFDRATYKEKKIDDSKERKFYWIWKSYAIYQFITSISINLRKLFFHGKHCCTQGRVVSVWRIVWHRKMTMEFCYKYHHLWGCELLSRYGCAPRKEQLWAFVRNDKIVHNNFGAAECVLRTSFLIIVSITKKFKCIMAEQWAS